MPVGELYALKVDIPDDPLGRRIGMATLAIGGAERAANRKNIEIPTPDLCSHWLNSFLASGEQTSRAMNVILIGEYNLFSHWRNNLAEIPAIDHEFWVAGIFGEKVCLGFRRSATISDFGDLLFFKQILYPIWRGDFPIVLDLFGRETTTAKDGFYLDSILRKDLDVDIVDTTATTSSRQICQSRCQS